MCKARQKYSFSPFFSSLQHNPALLKKKSDLPHCQRFMRPCSMSMGSGKTIVEFFSAAIVVRVWRQRSWRAAGDSVMTMEASFRALEAFISPSAAMTQEEGSQRHLSSTQEATFNLSIIYSDWQSISKPGKPCTGGMAQYHNTGFPHTGSWVLSLAVPLTRSQVAG